MIALTRDGSQVHHNSRCISIRVLHHAQDYDVREQSLITSQREEGTRVFQKIVMCKILKLSPPIAIMVFKVHPAPPLRLLDRV